MIAEIETGLYNPTHIGEHEAQGRHMTNKEIAQAVRQKIKEAKKAGIIPAEIKVSVRSDYLAVRVELSGWTQEQIWQEKETIHGYVRKEWTNEAAQIQQTVEQIRNAYNRECINGQIDYFDVRYYGTTQWQ